MKTPLFIQRGFLSLMKQKGAQPKGRENKMNIEVKVTKLEFLKNEDGTFVYDEKAIAKFRAKHIRAMERQNAKIAANPMKFRGFSQSNPEQYADTMVEIYKHHFRAYKEIPVNY